MPPKLLLSILLIFSSALLNAQIYKIHGIVTNNKLEPLPLVSISVKGSTLGTVTNNEGQYTLELEEGNYDLVITMVGFKSQILSIVVNKDALQNLILEEAQANGLEGVVITGKQKDRSAEIIKNVIRNKEKTLQAAGDWTANLYIKAVQRDSVSKTISNYTDTLPGKKENEQFKGMSLAEISLQLDHSMDGKIKEVRTGVKRNGKPDGLFYLSTTQGDFNFYYNLIKVPSISTSSFLSPISYSGLISYRYKLLKTKNVRDHKVYTIQVRPGKLSNATGEGEFTISDSGWVILTARFRFPSYLLAVYDYFEVRQNYELVNQTAWMLSRQEFTYKAAAGKHSVSGVTVVDYNNYQLNKSFVKHYFGNEVSATAVTAYTTDSSFWLTVRKEPLSEKEVSFIHYSDSAFRATHNKVYFDSIDKANNSLSWKRLLIGGQSLYNRDKERIWNFPPILSLYQPIAFGGTRINVTLGYSKVFKDRKNISIHSTLSYGFRNQDVNGNIRLTRMYNPFNRGFYSITLGRDFQFIYAGDSWINLLKRSNLYLNNGITLGHGLELANGLFFYSDIDVAFRSSLQNYKTGNTIDKLDSSLGNVLGSNNAVAFDPYNAVYGKLRLQYTPGQKYIREPLEKVILGSSWPTFYTLWRKGIPGILNSRVDFDYLEFGIEQQINLGLLGISNYSIKSGSFLNRKQLQYVDYQFQRRGDPLFYFNPNEAFQELDSTFPLFKQFYQGHFVHEFNGYLLNKIPLLRKLRLREVAGAGFLIAPERNLRYAETFAGIERVFKWPFNPLSKFKVGVYVVGSVANQFSNPVRFKVGITTWDKVKGKWF